MALRKVNVAVHGLRAENPFPDLPGVQYRFMNDPDFLLAEESPAIYVVFRDSDVIHPLEVVPTEHGSCKEMPWLWNEILCAGCQRPIEFALIGWQGTESDLDRWKACFGSESRLHLFSELDRFVEYLRRDSAIMVESWKNE